MGTFTENDHSPVRDSEGSRGAFLKRGIITGTLAGVTGQGLVTSCITEDSLPE